MLIVTIFPLFLLSQYFLIFSRIPANLERTQSSRRVQDLDDKLAVAMQRPPKADSSLSSGNDPTRILLVVVDALGYRWLAEEEGDLKDLIQDPDLSKDARLYRSTAQERLGDPDMIITKIVLQMPSLSFPNWISILTGVPPSLHGQMGNHDIVSNDFDSFFHRISAAKKKATILGDLAWASLLSDLPPGVTNLTRAFTSVEGVDHHTKRHYALTSYDDLVANMTLEVLASSSNPANHQSLILTYFGNVDAEAHSWGARRGSPAYIRALNATAAHLRSFLSTMHPDTILILTSDHGQVALGGHGGSSRSVIDTPLWIYRRGSRLRDLRLPDRVPQFRAEGEAVTALDVAPLITGLLGIAPPRDSFGKFPRDVLALTLGEDDLVRLGWMYHALALQRRELASSFRRQHGFPEEDSDDDAEVVGGGVVDGAGVVVRESGGVGGTRSGSPLIEPGMSKEASVALMGIYRDEVERAERAVGAAKRALASRVNLINRAFGVVAVFLVGLVSYAGMRATVREVERDGTVSAAEARRCVTLGVGYAVGALVMSWWAFWVVFGFLRGVRSGEERPVMDLSLYNSWLEFRLILMSTSTPPITLFLVACLFHQPLFRMIERPRHVRGPRLPARRSAFPLTLIANSACLAVLNAVSTCVMALFSNPFVVGLSMILDDDGGKRWGQVIGNFTTGFLLMPFVFIALVAHVVLLAAVDGQREGNLVEKKVD
ncbi:mannose-ethanolamine phosphotransferase gpi13 [Irineochytrium annulatum]|nr:mannose-ethanolamine phosphotransferase gpi13 [Irineochytrium annulatum]